MISIVDTGGANHTSVRDALLRLGKESEITVDRNRIKNSSHVILPGVGHARFAMERLTLFGLADTIVELKQPVLGICLGMQLLFSASDEGDTQGLSILPGRVQKMKPSLEFRVPHMGWNQLDVCKASRLLTGLDPVSRFYFVHSFEVPDGDWIVAKSQAPHPVPAVLEYRNFFATQFHPERSSAPGALVLKNFLSLEST